MLQFLELVVVLVLLLLLGSQVVWPLVQGTPWFPLFRETHPSQIGLAERLDDAQERLHAEEVEAYLADIRAEREAKRAARERKERSDGYPPREPGKDFNWPPQPPTAA